MAVHESLQPAALDHLRAGFPDDVPDCHRLHHVDSISAAWVRCGAVDAYLLPEEFAAQLERVLAPGQSDAAAAVIADALLMDDETLAAFLEAFAARVASSPEPVTAAELGLLLAEAEASRPSDSQRSSQ